MFCAGKWPNGYLGWADQRDEADGPTLWNVSEKVLPGKGWGGNVVDKSLWCLKSSPFLVLQDVTEVNWVCLGHANMEKGTTVTYFLQNFTPWLSPWNFKYIFSTACAFSTFFEYLVVQGERWIVLFPCFLVVFLIDAVSFPFRLLQLQEQMRALYKAISVPRARRASSKGGGCYSSQSGSGWDEYTKRVTSECLNWMRQQKVSKSGQNQSRYKARTWWCLWMSPRVQ